MVLSVLGKIFRKHKFCNNFSMIYVSLYLDKSNFMTYNRGNICIEEKSEDRFSITLWAVFIDKGSPVHFHFLHTSSVQCG